jgi:hypothetical protein
MDSNMEIEFQVDEQYENEKGVFTVVSIYQDQMVIRWENGEEMRTDIELQRNIQERRQWEQLQREKAAKTHTDPRRSEAPKKEFNGFEPGDFKNRGAGTTWRGRGQLGGALIRQLPGEGLDFNTWAVSNKPEMHCMDSECRRRSGAGKSARFFVRLDKEHLIFGFSAPRPKEEIETDSDWQAFQQWFGREENQRLLQTLAEENQLAIYSHAKSGTIKMTPSEDAWLLHDRNGTHPVDRADALLENLPTKEAVYIEVAHEMEKAAVLSRKVEITNDIVALFTSLMPLYTNAVIRNQS